MEKSELEDFMEMDPSGRYGRYGEILGKVLVRLFVEVLMKNKV
jgi:hypothetical protein